MDQLIIGSKSPRPNETPCYVGPGFNGAQVVMTPLLPVAERTAFYSLVVLALGHPFNISQCVGGYRLASTGYPSKQCAAESIDYMSFRPICGIEEVQLQL